MADGLYISMTGAAARAEQLDSIADDLANAQTPGFKAARPAFESFLPAGGAPDKVYPAAVSTGVDSRPGPVVRTGNNLDVLPEGDAFLAVRTANGVAYTRAGRLSVDANGQLTAAGFPLLDRHGLPITVPPGSAPSITAQGMVQANDINIAQIGIYRIDGTISRVSPQLLAPSQNASAVQVEGRLQVGQLELGNFGSLEAAVQLVCAQRHYETSMQALQTYKRLDDRAIELGRMR